MNDNLAVLRTKIENSIGIDKFRLFFMGREVRPSEDLSDKLITPHIVTKIARGRTSVQDTPPP